MKNVSLRSEQKVLLTVIGLCIAYFIGRVLISFFQSSVLPLITLRQDEVFGFLSLATVLPALKVKALKYPISLIDHTTKSGRNRKGVILGTENGRLDRELWYLALHSDFKASSIFDSQGYSVENKKPVYLVKPEFCNGRTDSQIIESVQTFLNTSLTKEVKKQITAKIAAKDAEKEQVKASKAANKVTKGKGNNITEVVAMLDIALERGLITKDQHTNGIKGAFAKVLNLPSLNDGPDK